VLCNECSAGMNTGSINHPRLQVSPRVAPLLAVLCGIFRRFFRGNVALSFEIEFSDQVMI